MGLLGKAKSKFNSEYCPQCGVKLQPTDDGEALYLLPMTVGHYNLHQDAAYYIKNARPIPHVGYIPVGQYACRVRNFRCSQCYGRYTLAYIFLQVREKQMNEGSLRFSGGELDALLAKAPKQPQP